MYLTKIQFITALGAVGLAALVLDLVRRRRLSEEYSLLWVVSTLTMAILGVCPPILRALTRSLGILYESSLVFFVGVVFGVGMLLYLSVRLSRMGQEQEVAVRELALLRHELEELRAGPPAGHRGGGA
jgi:hypothetical protein